MQFIFWTDADPSVGILGTSATVEIKDAKSYDKEDLGNLLDGLAQVFSESWDCFEVEYREMNSKSDC